MSITLGMFGTARSQLRRTAGNQETEIRIQEAGIQEAGIQEAGIQEAGIQEAGIQEAGRCQGTDTEFTH